jgi:hydrogenase-4 component B
MSELSIIRGVLLLFFAFCGAGLVLSAIARGQNSSRIVAIFSTICSVLMMVGSALSLVAKQSPALHLWDLRGFGSLSLQLDNLSAIFLFVSGLVYLPASLFGARYLATRFVGRYPGRRFGVLHFALMASVVIILISHDAYSFLISWECMSILCYFLINYEQTREMDSRAGYVMLAMSEAGFLSIVLAFLIIGKTASDFSFPALAAAASGLSNGEIWAAFLLSFL